MGWLKHGWKSFTNNPFKWWVNASEGNLHDAFNTSIDGLNKVGIIPDKKAYHLKEANPMWDYQEMQRPAGSIVNKYNNGAQVLGVAPEHAQMLGTTVASIVNPFLGAAVGTLFNAGNQQLQPDAKFNWGDWGKSAAINFGTAAASSALSKWAGNANTSGSVNAGKGASTGANSAGYTGSAALAPGTAGAAAAPTIAPLASGTGAAGSASSSAFMPALTTNMTSGAMKAFNSGVEKSGTALANQGLEASLAPEKSTAIEESTMPSSLQGGALGLFGGEELLRTPEAGRSTIKDEDYNLGLARIQNQDAMQRKALMDKFQSWGRSDYANTPEYQRQFGSITGNTSKTVDEYRNQSNLFNNYSNFKATNNLSDADMQSLISSAKADPSLYYAEMLKPYYSLYA